MTEDTKKTPKIEMKPVESSQLAAIGYDPQSQTLAIQFKGRGDTPGPVYHYFDFEPERFAEFEAAESKGSFFYQQIRSNQTRYPYQRQVADCIPPEVKSGKVPVGD